MKDNWLQLNPGKTECGCGDVNISGCLSSLVLDGVDYPDRFGAQSEGSPKLLIPVQRAGDSHGQESLCATSSYVQIALFPGL